MTLGSLTLGGPSKVTSAIIGGGGRASPGRMSFKPKKAGMDVYAIWPFFCCVGLMLVLASTPFFKPVAIPKAFETGRVQTLDGLRGFLALSVFFHHAIIYHTYLLNGSWELPPSRFYTLLGQVGVAMFFMITGYLFWGKLLREKGRPNIAALYIGRLFRIGPLYLILVFGLIGVVFLNTGLHLNEPGWTVSREIARWFALGFYGAPDINAYQDTSRVTAGVTWTLEYEWWFYLSLLATMFVARIERFQAAIWGTGLVICLGYIGWQVHAPITAPRSVCLALFIMGMLAASLERLGLAPATPSWLASVTAIGSTAAVFLFFENANAVMPIILLGITFFLIVRGSDLFGLLSGQGARRLGEISYGIYLLQGLALVLFLKSAFFRAFALESSERYWVMVAFCAIALVSAAGVAHLLIERPGIAFGRWVAQWSGVSPRQPALNPSA